MRGPLGVMSVLLLQAAVGGAVVLWATGVWRNVRKGFFLLQTGTVALCAWGAWATARSGIASVRSDAASGLLEMDALTNALTGTPGSRLLVGLLAFSVLSTLSLVVLALRESPVARALGLLASAAGIACLWLFAAARGERELLALAELAMGATFLGSTVFGLMLGHWYLTERRLSKIYMVRGAGWYIAGVLGGVGSAVLSAFNPARTSGGFSPFLSVPGFTLYLAAGLVAVCALIAFFVWKLANEGGRSIQAATGMFYLAVIMAFSAEMSAKFRFF